MPWKPLGSGHTDLAFFPAIFHFFVAWGKQRPRVINPITLGVSLGASLSLFSLVLLQPSFLDSFLQLHFPDSLTGEVVRFSGL